LTCSLGEKEQGPKKEKKKVYTGAFSKQFDVTSLRNRKGTRQKKKVKKRKKPMRSTPLALQSLHSRFFRKSLTSSSFQYAIVVHTQVLEKKKKESKKKSKKRKSLTSSSF